MNSPNVTVERAVQIFCSHDWRVPCFTLSENHLWHVQAQGKTWPGSSDSPRDRSSYHLHQMKHTNLLVCIFLFYKRTCSINKLLWGPKWSPVYPLERKIILVLNCTYFDIKQCWFGAHNNCVCRLVKYTTTYKPHDPFLAPCIPSNPWQTDNDTYWTLNMRRWGPDVYPLHQGWPTQSYCWIVALVELDLPTSALDSSLISFK